MVTDKEKDKQRDIRQKGIDKQIQIQKQRKTNNKTQENKT